MCYRVLETQKPSDVDYPGVIELLLRNIAMLFALLPVATRSSTAGDMSLVEEHDTGEEYEQYWLDKHLLTLPTAHAIHSRLTAIKAFARYRERTFTLYDDCCCNHIFGYHLTSSAFGGTHVVCSFLPRAKAISCALHCTCDEACISI